MATVTSPTSLVLGDSDVNTPSYRTSLFENYDTDRGDNTIWLAIGDSTGGDAAPERLWHFTWQTGEQGYGQRLVYPSWDAKGKGRLAAATVLYKDLPTHSHVVLTLGTLNFNQRLQLETIMQDTPIPHVLEQRRSTLRKEWCKQVLEKGVAMKLFTGFELHLAVQALELADLAC